MNITIFLTSLFWRIFKTQQPQTYSHILQLPVELLLEIFNFLPPYSQLLVYQTCRPLRIIIYQYFLAGKGEILLTLEYKLLYLTYLARSLPDKWTYSWDTPSSRNFFIPKCGDGKNWTSTEPSESRSFENEEYSPSHRHIELTLKYTRLKSQKRIHQQHLKRLLTAHHASTQWPCDYDVAKGILAQRSFYPKVVNERYLLLTVRTYLGAGTTISRHSIEFVKICPHLHAWNYHRLRSGLLFRLNTVLHMAFSAPPNTQIHDSCPCCRTDFTIQVSLERIIICVWQDLGPEGTIYDPDWGAIVRETTNVSHQPGSIRELYGQWEEHNGEVL
ncbi:hypothetical protein V8C35DRAFT_324615 [Trichoderma chlorosporum]